MAYGASRIVATRLVDSDDRSVGASVQSLGEYKLVSRIRAKDAVDDICFGFLLRDSRGLDLFGWDMLDGGLTPLEPVITPGRNAKSWCDSEPIWQRAITFSQSRSRTGTKQRKMCASMRRILIVAPTPGIFTASIVNIAIRFEPCYIANRH